jgi:hypothetical protein
LAYTHSRHTPEAKNKTLNFIDRKKSKVNDKSLLAGMSVCRVGGCFLIGDIKHYCSA